MQPARDTGAHRDGTRRLALHARSGLLLRRAVNLRPATVAEQNAIRALLVEGALPVDDLDEADVRFIVAERDGAVIGAIGLQPFDRVGLLRSLVVRAQARGEGVGAALVQALEAHASERGLERLVLLTLTAAPFFAARGYAVIARDDAPAVVQASAEFRSLCPASATCMSKMLPPTGNPR